MQNIDNEFCRFLKDNDFSIEPEGHTEEDKSGWQIMYMGECVGHMNYGNGGIWLDICDFGSGDSADDALKEFTWAHVRVCDYFSSGGTKCGCDDKPGLNKIIFGKEHQNICFALLEFMNPDAKALEKIKKLMLLYKQNKQLATLDKLTKQADAFVELRESLPENISAAWCKFVGQMREYFYMDEQWDGKEIVFIPYVKATLEQDKISISATEQQWEISTPEEVDNIIQTLVTMQLPERVMPTDNMKISAGNGRCDLCFYNRENSEKRGGVLDLATGMALAYGVICTTAPCESNNENCAIIDIGAATPGLTAEQVTHILFPYWWVNSKFHK